VGKIVSCHRDIVTRGESGSGKSHLCEKLMVEILKREKVTALWTKELFKVKQLMPQQLLCLKCSECNNFHGGLKGTWLCPNY